MSEDDSGLKISRRAVLVGLGGSVVACGQSEHGAESTGGAPTADGGKNAGGAPTADGGASEGGVGNAIAGEPSVGEGGTPSGGAGGVEAEGGAGGEPAEPVDECKTTSELTPSQLLAGIDHIVVLCMENRSFDHYLGSLSLREGRIIDGLKGGESNPDPEGKLVRPFLLENFTPADPPHEWDEAHRQWNVGKNDGFVREHAGPSQTDVMGYHVRSQLQALYALADAGAVCERYFCSLLGPTWPNRFYLHGATSQGVKTNAPVLGFQNLFGLLDEVGATHKNYYHDLAWASGAYLKLSGLAGIAQFFDDAHAGTLANVSIIDPQFFGAGANDDHPDHDVMLGQALIASVVEALGQSPQWKKTLFVLTYDEHGGFFDHVPPPLVTDERLDFQQLGFRVPAIVLGPHVRRGCSVSTVLEHCSLMKTLVTRFGIRSPNRRVDEANDFSSVIDPGLLAKPQPPPRLPRLRLSRSRILERPLGVNHHVELYRAAARLPRSLDRRSNGIGETEHVLRWGQELGVLRVER